ncbi:hypothetical protein THAOC_05548 [Thalassiosira oceanica]|uniref:Uncharacterized protein n=1 Tax=Thalassiosira oceanica TaxID=159749 RepID=K0TMQ0_THAOC|nr:hypothetical protein THAOC_05548 [Thalassiosira oceanica]|eukprot:EJK72877.1 hypothetical protein THAOC_05548 [Thalassiosira oceanica]
MMKIEVARSAYRVAHSRRPRPGITDGPREGPGKAVKRAFVENSTLASVRNCPLSAKSRPSVFGMGRKVASRNRLVELYKPLSIDVFRPTQFARGAHEEKDRRHSCGGGGSKTPGTMTCIQRPPQLVPGALAKKKTPGTMTAASRKTLGVLRRVLKRTRGVLRRRQGRADTTPAGGGASSGDRVRVVHRPSAAPPAGDVIPPRLASGGRRRSPSGLALLQSYDEGPGRGASPTRRPPPPPGMEGGRSRSVPSLSPPSLHASGGRGRSPSGLALHPKLRAGPGGGTRAAARRGRGRPPPPRAVPVRPGRGTCRGREGDAARGASASPSPGDVTT